MLWEIVIFIWHEQQRESLCSFRVGVFCYRTNVAMSLQYIGNVMNTSFATLERITNNSCLLTQWILTKKLNFFAISNIVQNSWKLFFFFEMPIGITCVCLVLQTRFVNRELEYEKNSFWVLTMFYASKKLDKFNEIKDFWFERWLFEKKGNS